ncbi:MAG: hypothetical protein KF906_04485 [Actinobacteria bacterium]|nr:hypothetical protein [Actinomycetota bacterium]
MDAIAPTTPIHPAPTPLRSDLVPAASPPLAARHFLAKLSFETDPSDLAADLAAGAGVDGRIVVVDTRRPEAHRLAHVAGAINLPHQEIDERTTADLDRGALYVAYCWGPACNASTRGAANLAALGFRVKELIGGLSAWQAEGFPVEGDAVDRPIREVDCAC